MEYFPTTVHSLTYVIKSPVRVVHYGRRHCLIYETLYMRRGRKRCSKKPPNSLWKLRHGVVQTLVNLYLLLISLLQCCSRCFVINFLFTVCNCRYKVCDDSSLHCHTQCYLYMLYHTSSNLYT